VNNELALVLTTDFFPPVCSDPYEFGQIAAANSISDVYAMGGDPVLALNIMMFRLQNYQWKLMQISLKEDSIKHLKQV